MVTVPSILTMGGENSGGKAPVQVERHAGESRTGTRFDPLLPFRGRPFSGTLVFTSRIRSLIEDFSGEQVRLRTEWVRGA